MFKSLGKLMTWWAEAGKTLQPDLSNTHKSPLLLLPSSAAQELPLGAASCATSIRPLLSSEAGGTSPEVLLPLPEEPGCGSSCSCLCQQSALASTAQGSVLLRMAAQFIIITLLLSWDKTGIFSRMWLESILEVRPYLSCKWQDETDA